jgi:hypothetical protein
VLSSTVPTAEGGIPREDGSFLLGGTDGRAVTVGTVAVAVVLPVLSLLSFELAVETLPLFSLLAFGLMIKKYMGIRVDAVRNKQINTSSNVLRFHFPGVEVIDLDGRRERGTGSTKGFSE